jgi:predicted ATPase/transcriptional regulator with XRE-family HTH domain
MDKDQSNRKNHVPNNRLKEERERRGLAHKDVAELIDLPDPHTVGRWERGESFPQPHYRQKLCQLFGKNAEELGLVKSRSGVNMQQPAPEGIESKRASEYVWKVPLSFTSFIGREKDVAAVCTLLKRADVRLVTLLGPGGVGKTRLSLQVANEMRDHFVDGVCFVSLAAISDPMLVFPTVAQVLGIQEGGAQSIVEQMKSVLHDKYFLLVLDNFEQVVMAASEVEELLVVCPGLKVLVTSRSVLHLQAEHEFAIAPLAIPNLDQLPALAVLLENAAVALFVQRAQAFLPSFQLTQSNARSIAEICVRLDGLPLAIELAAARIKLLPPKALLARLSQSLQLLKNELRNLPERQQMLYTTIRWSFDLLDEREQWYFLHLSIFPGGCTLEAAEAILSDGRTPDVLNILGSLIDKSLLQQVEQDGEMARFVMLRTMREYALDHLRTYGEMEECLRALAMYYLALVEQARLHLNGVSQTKWLALLEPEKENLRAALTWLIQHEEAELALRFCEAYGKYCGLRGYWSEEQYWLSSALRLPWTAGSASIRARVLRRAGHLAYRLRDLRLARELQEESVRLSSELGDKQNLAGALGGLGWVLYRQRDVASASQLLRESVTAARESEDTWAIANSLEGLGRLMHYQGYTDEARKLLDESVRLSRELEDKENLARILTTIVSIEIAQGNITQAAISAQESFALAQELGTRPLIALVLNSLGDVALFLGEYQRAMQHFEERLMLARELGDRATIALEQLRLGDIALAQGDPGQATTFVKESLRFFREQGDAPNIAAALSILGDIKRTQGEFEEAMILYKEAALLDKEIGNKLDIGTHFIGLATAAIGQGQLEQAARLFGFAESLLTASRRMHPVRRLNYERAVEHARAQLGEHVFMKAWSKGHMMTLEEALALNVAD